MSTRRCAFEQAYAVRGGRRTEARLTDDGFAKLEEIAPGHVREVHRLVIDVLTPEQLAASATPPGQSPPPRWQRQASSAER